MSKIDLYRQALNQSSDWEKYLLENSNLPGPRGNLELAHAAAQIGSLAQFNSWLANGPETAPTNDPHEFLTFCGTVGLGWLIAHGEREHLPRLRDLASDPRWRIREGVATGLQYFGDQDMTALLNEMNAWEGGNRYEQRAAVAALCEPRLLREPEAARATLQILDRITQSIPASPDRKTDSFQTLRKGLGYGWSVAIAALPCEGLPILQTWLQHPDPDVAWIMRENLKKNRLRNLLP